MTERLQNLSNPGSQRGLVTIGYWSSTLAEGAARIIIPLYLVSLGISATSIGIAFLFYEGFGLLTNMYGGFFANRYGYKRSFIIALGLHTIASLGYLFLFPEQSLWLSLLIVNACRAFRGMGKELIKTASTAYFKRLAGAKKESSNLPIQILLGGKDGMKGVGILIGGILLTVIGFQFSFIILGAVTSVCLVFSLRYIKDHREKKQVSYAGFFKVKRKMALLAWSRAFLYAGRDFWLVLPVPLYLNSLGYSDVSIAAVLAVGLVAYGLSQPLAASQIKACWTLGRVVVKQKMRYRAVAIWAPAFLLFLPLTMIFVPQHAAFFLVIVVLYNLGAGIATMPHNHLHLKYAKGKRTSIDIAYYKTIAQIGKVAAVPASGLIYSVFGIAGCLVASSISLCIAAVIASVLERKSSFADTLIDDSEALTNLEDVGKDLSSYEQPVSLTVAGSRS